MRFYWFATVVFMTLRLFFTPASAKYIAPNTAGSSGGACTNGTYAWPDSSGYLLKCVSGAWTKVTQSGTVDYNGTSCTSPSFMAGLHLNIGVLFTKPHIHPTLLANTRKFPKTVRKTK